MSVAADIFEIIGPIVAIALIGFLFAKRVPLDMSVPNRLNTDCLLPALIFISLVEMQPEIEDLARLGFYSAFVVLGSGALALPVLRVFGIQLRTLVPPVMFKNYGNLGLPLALFAFGEEGLAVMVVLAVAGNVLHLSIGLWILKGGLDPRSLLREPVIVAAALGIAVALLEIPLPQFFKRSLELLGSAAIPLMIFSLGMRMVDIPSHNYRLAVVGGIACPLSGLACFLLLDSVFGLSGLEREVMLVFSVLPPAVMNFMFAERYKIEPAAVAATVLVGTLFSLATIPAALAYLI